jgi:DNA repair exonuclease SbcCD ATPase subunit
MGRPKVLQVGRRAAAILFLGALAVSLVALTGCEQWTRMEENQVKLQAMVAANARQLATVSAQLHVAQGKIDDGVQQLDGQTQQVAAEVVTVQEQQRQLRDDVAGDHQQLHGQMTDLGRNQQSLQAGVAQVADVTGRTAAAVTALAQEQNALYQTVRTNQQELTGGLRTLADSHQQIRTGIHELQQADEGLAGSLAAMAGRQDALRQTLQDADQRATERLAALAAGHDQINADLGGVRTLAQTVASDVTAIANEQTALRAAAQSNTQMLVDKIALLDENQRQQRAIIDLVASTVNQTGTDVTALAATQTAVQESLAAHGADSASRLAALTDGQQNIQTRINALHEEADRASTELVNATSSLQESLKVTRDVLAGQMAASLQNQQGLQASAAELDTKVEALYTAVGTVATGQTGMQETLRTDHDAVVARLGNIAENQTGLYGSMSALAERTAAVVAVQSALRQDFENHGAAAGRQLAQMADAQQQMQGSLNSLAATTGQTADNVVAMTAQQNALRETVQKGSTAVSDQLTHVAHAQQQVQSNLNSLAAAAGQTADHVAAITTEQNALREVVQNGNTAVRDQLTRLADGQQQILGSVDTVTATAGQTALDIMAMTTQQNALRETVQNGDPAVRGQLTQLADGQQQMQNSLDVVTATAGQTALDVLAMTSQQDTLRQALQNGRVATGDQLTRLANVQEQIRDSLDTVTATTGQTALDAIALNGAQKRMEQTLQAGREELAAGRAEVAQAQQSWQQRFDTAQVKVSALAEGITALEQRVATLQGTLQTSLQELTADLSTQGEKRLQLDTKLLQDLQAIVESVSQLRQTQSSLREQMTEVQKAAPTRTPSAPSTAEPVPPPPVEVKLSDAGAPPTVLMEDTE